MPRAHSSKRGPEGPVIKGEKRKIEEMEKRRKKEKKRRGKRKERGREIAKFIRS